MFIPTYEPLEVTKCSKMLVESKELIELLTWLSNVNKAVIFTKAYLLFQKILCYWGTLWGETPFSVSIKYADFETPATYPTLKNSWTYFSIYFDPLCQL